MTDSSGEGDTEGRDGEREGQAEPLRKGLACLGERLVSVDTLFGQLEEEMNHDRQAR